MGAHGQAGGERGRVRTAAWAAVATVVAATLASAPLGFGSDEYKTHAPAQRCLGLVGAVVVLWATEAIPPYLTSLLIPLIAVPARVMCVPRHLRGPAETDTQLVPASYCNSSNPLPGTPMEAEQAVVVATGAFFDPVILLFLSGFVMSEVLVKRGISQRAARAVLARAGTGPRTVLAVAMLGCAASSSVISNVSAAVLGTSLLKPTFRASSGSWPVTALLGVAYACNVGGMTSPIASPQNVIALIALERATAGATTLSFLDWLSVSVPFCLACLVVIWGFLLLLHAPGLPAEVSGPWTAATNDLEMDLMLRDAVSDSDSDDADSGHSGGAWRGASDDDAGESGGGTQPKRVGGSGGGGKSSKKREARSPNSVLLVSPLLEPPTEVKVAKGAQGGGGDSGNGRRVSAAEDVFICVVIAATMGMWIFFHYGLKDVFGSIGIVGLIPIVLFGATGQFNVHDFNHLSWDVLILMGGGLSLGTIVESSGLLLVVGGAMQDVLAGAPLEVVLLAFTSLVALIANFISSTVAAVLLLPVVASVGVAVGHPRMLVLLCALMTSGAMGLPVSSFPNANSFAQRDALGAPVLENGHFVRSGFPVCALVLLLINSVAYGLALSLSY